MAASASATAASETTGRAAGPTPADVDHWVESVLAELGLSDLPEEATIRTMVREHPCYWIPNHFSEQAPCGPLCTMPHPFSKTYDYMVESHNTGLCHRIAWRRQVALIREIYDYAHWPCPSERIDHLFSVYPEGHTLTPEEIARQVYYDLGYAANRVAWIREMDGTLHGIEYTDEFGRDMLRFHLSRQDQVHAGPDADHASPTYYYAVVDMDPEDSPDLPGGRVPVKAMVRVPLVEPGLYSFRRRPFEFIDGKPSTTFVFERKDSETKMISGAIHVTVSTLQDPILVEEVVLYRDHGQIRGVVGRQRMYFDGTLDDFLLGSDLREKMGALPHDLLPIDYLRDDLRSEMVARIRSQMDHLTF